jgi:hypothetical protein
LYFVIAILLMIGMRAVQASNVLPFGWPELSICCANHLRTSRIVAA